MVTPYELQVGPLGRDAALTLTLTLTLSPTLILSLTLTLSLTLSLTLILPLTLPRTLPLQLALTDGEWSGEFILDYGRLLPRLAPGAALAPSAEAKAAEAAEALADGCDAPPQMSLLSGDQGALTLTLTPP